MEMHQLRTTVDSPLNKTLNDILYEVNRMQNLYGDRVVICVPPKLYLELSEGSPITTPYETLFGFPFKVLLPGELDWVVGVTEQNLQPVE